MSKAYPSNLTQPQFEMLNDLLPPAKPGGRPRSVDLWQVLNALFYLLGEGCQWRALPGDFPPWQTVYSYFRTWRKDGTWVKIHDTVRQWVRIEQERQPSPSEACLDSKRFLTVDTLGLMLGVWVCAASVTEREGGKHVLQRVKQQGKAVSRLHTIWVVELRSAEGVGGFDGDPFMQWLMDCCRWIVEVVLRLQQTKGFVLLKKRWVVERTALKEGFPPQGTRQESGRWAG